MRSYKKWMPSFDERLAQSRRSKTAQVRRVTGYRLYHLQKFSEPVKHSPGPTKGPNGSFYSWSAFYGRVTLVDEVRWLKPKHVTLLRMQGITCTLFGEKEDSEEIESKVGVRNLTDSNL